MLKLDSYLQAHQINNVREYTKQRFSCMTKYRTPEALSLYELRLLDTACIKELCEREYGIKLEEPVKSHVPENIIDMFKGTGLVPVSCAPLSKLITAVYLQEFGEKRIEIPNYIVRQVPTTTYYYFENYVSVFGNCLELLDVTAKMMLDFICEEGIALQASDITITSTGRSAHVYYNVRGAKVRSNRIITYGCMEDIITLITIKSPIAKGSKKPKYVDFDINKHYRSRVTINHKDRGYMITMRLFEKNSLSKTLKEWNLSDDTIKWYTTQFRDEEAGLRLIVGKPMSGKNTTASTILMELAKEDKLKIISVESPVEQHIDGVEQLSAEDTDDYVANVQSLIRCNPDLIYITEITDETASDILKISNVGNRVISTIHANSVSDTISRIMDLTGMSLDRVIQNIHSICFQKLVRDDEHDVVYPMCRYLRFTNELKYQMYGKSLGEVLKIINDNEQGDLFGEYKRG